MRRRIAATTLAVLALGAAGPAEAGWQEGVAAYRAGDYVTAAREFNEVVKGAPDSDEGYFMLGRALEQIDRLPEALGAYRRAYELDPNVRYQFALANACLAAERYDDALDLYERIDPSNLTASDRTTFEENKALALEASGRRDAAPETRPDPAADPEEEAKQMIVMVRCKLGGVDTFGAGIIVGSRTDRLYIVTANHVVRKGLHEAEDLRVELRFLPGETLEANLLEQVDEELDLAVLNVPGLAERHISVAGLPFDLLGDAEALEYRDPVFHVGNPNGNRWRTNLSPDLVSEVLGTEVRFESSFIAPGSSGGGLFDEHWTLVGLVRADAPPDGVAVRFDRVLERLEAWGYPVDLAPGSRAEGPADQGDEASAVPAGAVEGWAILGAYENGRFSDLVIDLPGDAPAIGSTYRTVRSFRLLAEKPVRGQATITLGVVPAGSTIQVLDLDVPSGSGRVTAEARIRARVERVRPPAPEGPEPEGTSPRDREAYSVYVLGVPNARVALSSLRAAGYRAALYGPEGRSADDFQVVSVGSGVPYDVAQEVIAIAVRYLHGLRYVVIAEDRPDVARAGGTVGGRDVHREISIGAANRALEGLPRARPILDGGLARLMAAESDEAFLGLVRSYY